MKLLPLLIFIFSCNLIFANEDTTSISMSPAKSFELIANCSQFAKQFLSLTNNSLEISPYLVGVRAGLNRHYLRAQLGVDYRSNSQSDPVAQSSNSILINTLNIRLGYQYRIPISTKFTSYIGPDILINYTQNKTTSEFSGFTNESNVKSTGFGAGLGMGLQWNLSHRIAISTETSLNFIAKKGTNVQSSFSPSGPSFTSTADFNEKTISVTPPTSIFFHLKF